MNLNRPRTTRRQSLRALMKLQKIRDRATRIEPPFYHFVPQYEEAFRDYSNKYIVMKGGRGPGKSFGTTCFLIEESFKPEYKNSLFLFIREIQTSIEDSVYALVKSMISQAHLDEFFIVKEKKIINKVTGVEFAFIGMRATGGKTAFSQVNKIKGKFAIKYIFGDEAQDFTEETLNVLFPTANRGSKVAIVKKKWHPVEEEVDTVETRFIFAMNPNFENDPVLAKCESFGSQAKIMHVNIFDIPAQFQDLQLLEQAKAEEGEIYYGHVWLGEPSHKISGYPWMQLEESFTNDDIRCVAFLDPSFKGGDYTALSFVGVIGRQLYCWGTCWRKAWNMCLDEICEQIELYRPSIFEYEDNGGMGAVPEDMFGERRVLATGRTSFGNKEVRIFKIAAFTAHRTHMIRNRCNNAWADGVIKYNLESENDDAPDSLASAFITAGIITDKMKF